MIFQEKATKEMLEHNNLRESAIIGSDESLIWKLRTKTNLSSSGNIFPRVINKNWIKRNSINQKIGLEGVNKFSNVILESWNHGGIDGDISFSDNLLSNGNTKNKKILARFKAHLIASNSDHALWNHNRRFYFDPINKSLIPIYYDGKSRIRNMDKPFYDEENFKDRLLTRDISSKDFEYAINEIKEINLSKLVSKLNSAGVKIKKSELIKIKNQLVKIKFFKRKQKSKIRS